MRVLLLPGPADLRHSGQDQRPVPVRQPVCEYAGQLCTGDGGPWRPQGFYPDVRGHPQRKTNCLRPVSDCQGFLVQGDHVRGGIRRKRTERNRSGNHRGHYKGTDHGYGFGGGQIQGFTDRTVEQGGRDQDSPGVYGPKTPGRALRPHASGHG